MVVVKEFKGFVISISPYNGTFYAYEKKDEEKKEKYRAATMGELEEIIKRHVSNKRHFKPINVIHIDDDRVGRITSRTADRDDSVYFTFRKDPTDKKERPSRTTARIEGYEWVEGNRQPTWEFAQATEANLTVLEKIKDLDNQIKALRTLQQELRKTYGEPVTWELIEERGGS
jgi:hypothetical protein